MVPIGVSARHIHLTQEHVEALFGPGYQLTKKKELMGGQFASHETVTKMCIRDSFMTDSVKSQVETSKTISMP